MAKNMYQKRAERKAKAIEEKTDKGGLQKTVINWYPGHMAKAKRLMKEKMSVIDIVFEVIDARMPYSSKIKDIDEIIQQKPRLLIMTKLDLCDKKETNKWVSYYEEKGYTVVLVNLEGNSNVSDILKATNRVMNEKKEARLAKGMKDRRTRALVVGIPNVGKSTLINRLVGKKAANVGNKPGVTKSLDWIRISNDLELLDSPGVLWPKLDEERVALNLASLTAIKEEVLPIYDVVCYIIKMLYQYYPKELESRYGVTEIDEEDMVNTLDMIGKRRGCIIRGGEIDYDRVMNLILNDMKSGMIKGITFDRYEDIVCD